MPVREIPRCVAAAYEQFTRGESVLNLEHPQPTLDLERTYSLETTSLGINSANKSMLLFLAARDTREQKDRAYAIWQDVKKLTGDGNEYEYQAATLLRHALDPPNFQAYTRSQLKALDDNVARAAINLSKALRPHPDFRRESSVINWPEDDAERIAMVMKGLEPQAELHSLEKKNGAPIFRRLPMRKLWTHFPSQQNSLFSLVAAIVPTMEEMLDVLARRAQDLSSKRFKAKKGWQATGEANDAYYIRHLLAQMIFRNPTATAHQVAKIISPIVDKGLGVKMGHWQRTFERCKKAAKRIQTEIESDPQLQHVAMLNNPHSPYWAKISLPGLGSRDSSTSAPAKR